MSKSKHTHDQHKEAKEIRKLSVSLSERAPQKKDAPFVRDTAHDGHTTLGVRIGRITKKKKGHNRIASVSVPGHFYSPAHQIAGRINDAMSVDNIGKEQKPCIIVGSGAPVIRVRGEVIDKTEQGGVRIRVYGVNIWTRDTWIEDMNDGTLRINTVAFSRNNLLKWARARHEKRKAEITNQRSLTLANKMCRNGNHG